MSKITIQTVADQAGVSIKTVSRVINKEPSVKSSTRDKVRLVINKLGYEPSPAAQALASNRSKIIGLVYDNPSAAYVMAVQSGVLNACGNDYNLVIHPCDHTHEHLVEDLLALVQKSRLDGLILTPPLTDMQPLIDALISAQVNLVTIAPAHNHPQISSVSCNDANTVERIITQLINKGHKDIAFVTGPENHGAAYQRLLGYKAALNKADIPINSQFIYTGEFSYESGILGGQTLLSLPKQPSAIFASNDYMAAGVMRVAHEQGISVPSELAIIGFDDAPVAAQIWPALTTIKQPVQEMAEHVTGLLINNINMPKAEVVHHTHLAEIILRSSA